MATVKSYTDLEQSRKLAEMLPLESADYHYIAQGEKSYFYPYSLSSDAVKDYDEEIKYIPCWSLAALFNVLPAECECMALEHINYGNNHKKYFMHYVGGESTEDYVNAIDACIAMIEKLNELGVL